MLFYLPLVAALVAQGALALPKNRVRCDGTQGSFHDYNATNLYGNETVNFSDYKGKVVLLYNIATG